jgi:hypothetical protein
MAWLSDYRAKLVAEINEAAMDISTGGCMPENADVGQLAMAYCSRLGFINGLQRAMVILEEVEKMSG